VSRICNKLVSSANVGAKGLDIHTSKQILLKRKYLKNSLKSKMVIKQSGIFKEATVCVMR
jgi:hypothetical protein